MSSISVYFLHFLSLSNLLALSGVKKKIILTHFVPRCFFVFKFVFIGILFLCLAVFLDIFILFKGIIFSIIYTPVIDQSFLVLDMLDYCDSLSSLVKYPE